MPTETLGGLAHNPFGLQVCAPLLAEQAPINSSQRSLLITLKRSQFALAVGHHLHDQVLTDLEGGSDLGG